jgi:plasmid stability protein
MRQQAGSRPRSRRRQLPAPSPGAAATRQYTVRNIPEHVDRALRRKAARERKSLNAILRDALIREADATELSGRVYTDLDAFAGTWVDDAGFDDAIRAQDQVDESLWP